MHKLCIHLKKVSKLILIYIALFNEEPCSLVLEVSELLSFL